MKSGTTVANNSQDSAIIYPGWEIPDFRFVSSLPDLLKANPSRISRKDVSALRNERKVAAQRFQENQAAFREDFQDNIAAFTSGSITRGQAQWRLQRAIRERYRTAFEMGKRMSGNLYLTSPDEERWLRKIRKDEFVYLRGFLDDIENNRGVMPYAQRAEMYIQAIRELGWLGWLIGNQSPMRRIVWRLQQGKEHCESCQFMAKHTWTVKAFLKQVKKTGWLPQAGTLKCLGYHCGCKLEEFWIGGK